MGLEPESSDDNKDDVDNELSGTLESISIASFHRHALSIFDESSSDCSFQADDGKMFRLHKAILSQSPVFKVMLRSGFQESGSCDPIPLKECSSDVLSCSFDFLYGTPWKDASMNTLLGIWEFGHKYDLKILEACATKEAEALMDYMSCLDVMKYARRLSNHALSKRCHAYFREHFPWGQVLLNFEGLEAEDVRQISQGVNEGSINLEAIYFCTGVGENITTPGVGGTWQKTSHRCMYPEGILSTCHALLEWQGEDEERISCVDCILSEMNFDYVNSADMVEILSIIQELSPSAGHAMVFLRHSCSQSKARGPLATRCWICKFPGKIPGRH